MATIDTTTLQTPLEQLVDRAREAVATMMANDEHAFRIELLQDAASVFAFGATHLPSAQFATEDQRRWVQDQLVRRGNHIVAGAQDFAAHTVPAHLEEYRAFQRLWIVDC